MIRNFIVSSSNILKPKNYRYYWLPPDKIDIKNNLNVTSEIANVLYFNNVNIELLIKQQKLLQQQIQRIEDQHKHHTTLLSDIINRML